MVIEPLIEICMHTACVVVAVQMGAAPLTGICLTSLYVFEVSPDAD